MSEIIVQVLDSINEEASGPSYSVPRLCGALAERGVSVELLTIGNSQSSFSGFRHVSFPADFEGIPILCGLRFSSALKDALVSIAERATIIHTHGLWRMCNIYPASVALRAKKQLVLSPRGMLGDAALRFSAGKKKLFWKLVQGRVARAVTCLHATSRQEYEDIRAFGLRAPIAIIPNGIDVVGASPKRRPSEAQRTLLYLGRLHPKKGLDDLIEAWKLIEAHHPDWHLDIVGPIDSVYAHTLKSRIKANPVPRVRLLGPLYGDEKQTAYRRADLFILPTLNDNFAMTVAEALAQATPVISTKGAPWSGLVTRGCGWWTDQGIKPLAAAMDDAMSMKWEALASMGQRGQGWMARDFDWRTVATSMQSVYDWLIGRGARPDCVVLD
jgi:glycosyltransferase involved in cell wall biosynthesis